MALRRLKLLFLLVGAAEAAILPFLPIVLDDRGLSPAQIGLVLALASLAGFLATPVWGDVADRLLGPERAFVLACSAAAVAAIPLAFAHGVAALALTVVALTAARSATASLTDSIALEHLTGGSAQYGNVRLWLSIGWAVSACVWGAVLELGSITWLPAIYGASVLTVAAVTYALREPRRVPPRREHGARRRMLRELAPFLTSLLFVFAAYSATFSFVSVRIADLGGGLFVIGAATAIQGLAEAPTMRLTPRLARRVDHRALYGAGAGFIALGCAAWAFLDTPVPIALVKVVVGVGFALAYVGSVVIVDDLSPPGLRGTGQGVAKAVCFGLSPILGSLAGGLIYDYAGPPALFGVCAAAAAVAGLAPALRLGDR